MNFQENITQPNASIVEKAEELNLGPLLEPEAVPFTFETIGWPILLCVIILVSLIVSFRQIRKYKRNLYRKQALAELQLISTGHQDLAYTFVILKRTAILAFSRENVGNLSGQSWLKFLEESGQNVEMMVFEKEIENLIYKEILPEKGIQQKLLSNAEKWIRTHAS